MFRRIIIPSDSDDDADGITATLFDSETSQRAIIVAVNEQQKCSRKRIRNESAWKRNVIKKARLHGQEYVNSKSDIIGAKTPNFDMLCGTKECRLRCSTKLENDERANILSEFYKLNAEHR